MAPSPDFVNTLKDRMMESSPSTKNSRDTRTESVMTMEGSLCRSSFRLAKLKKNSRASAFDSNEGRRAPIDPPHSSPLKVNKARHACETSRRESGRESHSVSRLFGNPSISRNEPDVKL